MLHSMKQKRVQRGKKHTPQQGNATRINEDLKPTGDNFEEWWNEKNFYHNTPLYPLFKKLAGLKANFRYIDFLCATLRRGDKLAAAPTGTRKLVRPGDREFLNALELFGARASYLTSSYLKELHSLEESHFPELSLQDYYRIIRQTFKDLSDMQKDRRLLRYSSLLPRFLDEAARDPVLLLFKEFAHRRKQGNQRDPLGFIFS
jgi:hypothetical protein